MSTTGVTKPDAPSQRTLPPVTGDFYSIATTVSDDDKAILAKVRVFMEAEVAPIINDYWIRAAFPFDLIPKMAALDIAGISYTGYGCAGKSTVLDGLIAVEMARIDPSIATFFGVHSGLAMGSLYLCGSEEQKQQWLPAMRRMEKIGAFGLTEPEVGSGASGGLMTTARREGDEWVLNGQKKWIGNATFADVTVIWARDEADNQVKGFLVEKGTPGFSPVKMEDKMALRVVQNALITLTDCRVSEANRLQNARSFRDTAAVLRMTRAGVAWQAVGCAMGAYEHALAYSQTAQTVWQTHRQLPARAGFAGGHAGQYHGVAVHGAAALADAGRRGDERRARLAGQGVLHEQVSRDGWLRA